MMEARAGISEGTGNAAETARVTARLRRRADLVRSLKQRADSICLTADGVVPLDLGCPSSREAQLGPAGTAYTRSGIVVATDVADDPRARVIIRMTGQHRLHFFIIAIIFFVC